MEGQDRREKNRKDGRGRKRKREIKVPYRDSSVKLFAYSDFAKSTQLAPRFII
jgi:hypothetical protein